jgi:hypothetical protein
VFRLAAREPMEEFGPYRILTTTVQCEAKRPARKPAAMLGSRQDVLARRVFNQRVGIRRQR